MRQEHLSFVDWGFLGSSAGKESTCNIGDLGLLPRLRNSPGEGIGYPFQYSWALLVAQMVKNPPAIWKTWVWSPSWEDPLEKDHNPRVGKMPWRRIPDFVPRLGRYPGVGHGNLHQYSCLVSIFLSILAIDRGAWWTTVHEVSKMWTQLNH